LAPKNPKFIKIPKHRRKKGIKNPEIITIEEQGPKIGIKNPKFIKIPKHRRKVGSKTQNPT
jgi:hypothetical protein